MQVYTDRENEPAWAPCRVVVSSDTKKPMRKEGEEIAPQRGRNDTAFVFGVSGHRDLVPADLPELRQQLREIFRRSISSQPNKTFQLLTPLAEGADRIAAEEALALGIKLVVPMPMLQAEYERDFTRAESLAEFRRLLKAADEQFELTDAPTISETDKRAQRYAAVGDYIARKSHLLILLWDGRDNQKVGGTAWVRTRREDWSRIAKENGDTPALETIHVATRRLAATPR